MHVYSLLKFLCCSSADNVNMFLIDLMGLFNVYFGLVMLWFLFYFYVWPLLVYKDIFWS